MKLSENDNNLYNEYFVNFLTNVLKYWKRIEVREGGKKYNVFDVLKGLNRISYYISVMQSGEEQRRKEAEMIRKFHPDKIPILLSRGKSSKLKQFDNSKILILKSFTVFKLIMVIKKKLQINYSQAIYVFAGNTLLQADQTLDLVYDKYVNADNFLHLTYCQYSTFGSHQSS